MYEPLELGRRSTAAPKIGVQESSLCIAFMAVIFYAGNKSSPYQNQNSRVLKFWLLWLLPYAHATIKILVYSLYNTARL